MTLDLDWHEIVYATAPGMGRVYVCSWEGYTSEARKGVWLRTERGNRFAWPARYVFLCEADAINCAQAEDDDR